MTIAELLLTPYYRGNKTLLAKELKINRGTLRKYLPDTNGELHFIRGHANKLPEIFTNQSSTNQQKVEK